MLSDLKLAFRSLRRAPASTLIAILTLALGIGAATTSFSILNALLLRPLPFIQHQERMLYLNEAVPSKGVDGTDICYADFLEWRKRSQTLAALWVTESRTVILAGKDEPLRLAGTGLSTGAFAAMGVQPFRGRDFRPEEYDSAANPVALLGYGLWQRSFGGDDNVIGRTVTLNGQATTIIGVMPKGWRYPETSDIWLPLRIAPGDVHHGFFSFNGHAMLKPGVSLDEARSELAGISDSLAREFPATNEGLVAVLRPVREEATEDTAQGVILIFGAVLFVFLIACTNVVNLLLARASTRTREIAVRLALGASRGQIIRHLLTESLLLGAIGGVAGLLAGLWGLDLVLTLIPVEIPFWLRFDFDFRVFAFTTVLTLLGSLFFGLVPAWQASRPQLVDEIKEGGRGSVGGRRGQRIRQILVIIEIALALVLLVAAGLSMRSFFALGRVAPGFDPSGVLTFRVGFPPALEVKEPTIARYYNDLTQKLAALPGASSAAATTALPGLGNGGYAQVLVEGRPVPANFSEVPVSLNRVVTPDYFATLRVPLRRGRTFDPRDDSSRPSVAVVDEDFVNKFFPGQDPIGKRFRTTDDKPGKPAEWREIVGVVGSTRRWFDRAEPIPSFYLPHQQVISNFMSVAVRVSGNPADYVKVAREAVLSLDPRLPIYFVYPLDRAIAQSESMWKRRFFGSIFTAFAGIALVLAAIGIYGVMSHAVTQRTQEIGIRMALGAQTADILRMVVHSGLRTVALGLAAGLIGAWFVAHLLASTLYGVSPHDPPTFAAVPLFLAATALLACLVPALRASRVDPLVALRAE